MESSTYFLFQQNRSEALLERRQLRNRDAADAENLLDKLRVDLQILDDAGAVGADGYNELCDLVELYLSDHQSHGRRLTHPMRQQLVQLAQSEDYDAFSFNLLNTSREQPQMLVPLATWLNQNVAIGEEMMTEFQRTRLSTFLEQFWSVENLVVQQNEIRSAIR